MNNIEQNLQIIQILIPSICIGVLFIGLLLCLYIYYRNPTNLYLSLLCIGIIGFLYVLSELMITIVGGWYYNRAVSVQIHRFGQVVLPFLFFSVPFFITNLLKLNKTWHKVNKVIAIIGLIFSIFIFFIAFIDPDKYFSIAHPHENLLNYSILFGRGKAGIVVQIRNILFFVLIIYSIITFVTEFAIHKNYELGLLPFFGLLIAGFCAVDDIIISYSYEISGIFSTIHFSRFSMGISFFIIFSMIMVVNQFINQANKVTRTYNDLNGAYKALQKSEERFKQLAENLNEIFIIFDYKNNVFLYVSPAYENIWSRTCESLYKSPMSFFKSIYHDDVEEINSYFISGNIEDKFELKFRLINDDGKIIKWVRMKVFVIRDMFKEIYRIVGILEDITKSKKAEDELTFIAYHDIITGLPNRRSFYEKFYDLILQENRNSPINDKALFYLDLYRFKYINETLGREYGDELLKEISKRMKQCLRKNDYLYRLDSDEFIIILNTISNNLDPAIVAKKLIDVINVPFIIENREVFVGLCIGISVFPRDGTDVEKLLHNADIALNEARKNSNSYSFFNSKMNDDARERSKIEYSLRYAIEKKDILLNFQPVVSKDKKIISMEALIRWDHPELGLISPDKFIPIAEATGQIIEIGEWVIRESCGQLKKWHNLGFDDLKIAINLSPKQFRDEFLIEKINNIIDEIDISADNIEFEITESSVMENPEEVQKTISNLNARGITFSIDDFGTGYSSFGYLKRFKISCLKVDKSFIKDILIDEDNTEITRAIIALAHNLNLRVIAEGVETQEQMNYLKTIDCDAMQGYLFSKPLNSDQFLELLKKGII